MKQLLTKFLNMYKVSNMFRLKNYIDFNHLKEINSGYFKHLFIALYFVFITIISAVTGLIHAFIPFLFPFTPYLLVKKVVDGTEKYFMKK